MSGLKTGIERLQNYIGKYETMLSKYNENLGTTEDLLRRIDVLEQRTTKLNECKESN